MCGSMVDIQSATAEIRRGKRKKDEKQQTTGQKYNVRICYAGRPESEMKTGRVHRRRLDVRWLAASIQCRMAHVQNATNIKGWSWHTKTALDRQKLQHLHQALPRQTIHHSTTSVKSSLKYITAFQFNRMNDLNAVSFASQPAGQQLFIFAVNRLV